jgi:hypothetical protein
VSETDEYGVPLDACEGDGWYPQYRRSQKWARAEYPDGYDVELPGRHAWSVSTEAQRADALGSLFHAYWVLLHDEDNERRLDVKADDGTSYLKPGDVATLWTYTEDRPNEHGEVRADRGLLMNVLCEVELLQHRLTRFTNRDDSGESHR